MEVYGPYTDKKGRKYVVIEEDNGHKHSMTYAKYLMQKELGRTLDPNLECVDHKNDDCTDDRIDNYQLKTRGDNTKKELERRRNKK